MSHPRALSHFSPLRYPGGKGRLAPFVKGVIELNALSDGIYCEPYAGGAAIALELLFQSFVDEIYINDLSPSIYAFWKSVLDHTDALLAKIRNTPITTDVWYRQKAVLQEQDAADVVALGFSVFFLNRTNRSGILNGGLIGGKDQSGPWKMDARYNTAELMQRVESIAKLRDQIHLSGLDALDFMSRVSDNLQPSKTLLYLDPPYYRKGHQLYYNYYQPNDHRNVARYVLGKLRRFRWLVSYDNVPEIHALYSGQRRLEYSIGYSARESRVGSEVMFYSPLVCLPPPIPTMTAVERG